MSLLFFFRSNYWVRRRIEYQEPDKPRKRKKKVYRVVYDRARAEAMPVNLKEFARDVKNEIIRTITKKRQKEEEELILLHLFGD